jgi:hypothetical protein
MRVFSFVVELIFGGRINTHKSRKPSQNERVFATILRIVAINPNVSENPPRKVNSQSQ